MLFLVKCIIVIPLWLLLSSSVWGSSPTHNFVVILLDASGSMKRSDPQFLRRDATNLLINLLRDGDRLVLAEFGDEVRGLTDGAVTLNPQTRQTIRATTARLTSQDQNTDILAACQYALQVISALPAEFRQSFTPSVILMTDGKDDVRGRPNRSSLIEDKIKELAKLGIRVHAVGFSPEADLVLLRTMADLSGGDLCVINRDVDLLRGFFGLSRILGRRWALSEQTVSAGPVQLTPPAWAKRLVVCYLPKSRTGARMRSQIPAVQEIIDPSYQVLMFADLAAPKVDLLIPAEGGMLFLDAEAEIVLQSVAGKKVPARVPFEVQAQIRPAIAEDLGQPRFLTQTAMSVTLWREGQPEITVQLYDDSQHNDGQAGDGFFSGYVPGLPAGAWRYRITAKAPLSPTLATEGQMEALAMPLTVRSPGRLSQFLWAPFTKQLSWKICNQTDTPVTGEFSVTRREGEAISRPVIWKGGQCQEVSLSLPPQAKPGEFLQAAVFLSRQSEPIWEGQYRFIPWWLPILTGLIGIGLVGLTFIFPRRSVEGSILRIVTKMNGEELVRVLRIDRHGRVAANDLPAPCNDPGVFRARSGLWRRGIVFEPASWCQPSFPGKTPPRNGRGYLLRRPTTWRCFYQTSTVEYKLSPRLS